MARSFAVLALLAACSHAPRRPTVTGAELYAQVPVLQATGRATVRDVTVRKDQVLTTGSQVFLIEQVIAQCRGGEPTEDIDCTLALLLDQQFTVLDHAPVAKSARGDSGDDKSGSMLTAGVVVGLGVAAIGGLGYGVATCEFEGCKAVFGVPLILIGGGALLYLLLSSHHD